MTRLDIDLPDESLFDRGDYEHMARLVDGSQTTDILQTSRTTTG